MNGTVLATDIKQPYAFTGREYDQETGLYNYRARYYDVNTGRFVSKDPIGFSAGDVNLYRYVGNNPVNRLIDKLHGMI
ncbi:MAG: RHS repeat-associated core domain-containing protein [Nitrospirae bacterium]|nr:RHS repeat-associated core domain-containing protein [Nitrospirota bacterium]